MPTHQFAWFAEAARPLMPADSVETVNGQKFQVPKGARSMAVYTPALVGTTTLKIQALTPQAPDVTTETFVDCYVFDLSDGTFEQLDGIPESQVTIMPVAALAGGWLRFVASSDQSSAPVRIPVSFAI